MESSLKGLLTYWAEKNASLGGDTEVNGNLREIAMNCLSLSSSWIERAQNTSKDKVSFQLIIFDKFGEERDRMIDVDIETLPKILLDTITFENKTTSKVELYSFKYVNSEKKMSLAGQLEIS